MTTATATKTSLEKRIQTASNFIALAPIVGKFCRSLILKDCIKVQEKKKKVVVLCSPPGQNLKLGTFTL